MTGKAYAVITYEEHQRAKAVVYGMLFGQSAASLAGELKIQLHGAALYGAVQARTGEREVPDRDQGGDDQNLRLPIEMLESDYQVDCRLRGESRVFLCIQSTHFTF